MFCSLAILTLIARALLPTNIRINLLIISTILLLIITIYIGYTALELSVFHEKQGSKLNLTKNKLSINIWD